jgi:hypothetical protein
MLSALQTSLALSAAQNQAQRYMSLIRELGLFQFLSVFNVTEAKTDGMVRAYAGRYTKWTS